MSDPRQGIMAGTFGICAACEQPLPLSLEKLEACPRCHGPLLFRRFPAFFRASLPAGNMKAVLAEAQESSCFYHPLRKSSSICSSCGAFICSLCEIVLQAEPICPACLEKQNRSGKHKILTKNHYLWDNIAIALSFIVSIPFYFISFAIAPAVLVIVARHWNSHSPFHKVSRIKMCLAAGFSCLVLLGWLALLLFLFNELSKSLAS